MNDAHKNICDDETPTAFKLETSQLELIIKTRKYIIIFNVPIWLIHVQFFKTSTFVASKTAADHLLLNRVAMETNTVIKSITSLLPCKKDNSSIHMQVSSKGELFAVIFWVVLW